jgi:hypothetical protein
MNLRYLLTSGKRFKAAYYASEYLRLLIPKSLYRRRLARTLRNVSPEERAALMPRVLYYNRLPEGGPGYLSEHPEQLDQYVRLADQPVCRQKVYYFDTYRYFRWFPQHLRWRLISGDVPYVAPTPAVVKSRPIAGDNRNSVLMKLNQIRHFIFVHDTIPWTAKRDLVVFRGKVGRPGSPSFKEVRYRFLEHFWDSPFCDLGDVGRSANPQWLKPKLTIREHLDFKFILCLEGNDVASNLKWVMSSNSLAVMPRPTCETWFMEGILQPGVHYVEIRDDFSDLREKMDYYIAHPDEAQRILDAAHAYVAQFRDSRRERLISLMVLDRYLRYVNGPEEGV